MRHRKKGRKLSRKTSHRLALERNITIALFRHERIVTTVEKAKEFRGFAEHLISLGKRGDLHARRQALALIPDRTVVKKLFAEIAPRFKDRPGGYTRVIKLGGSRMEGKGSGRWAFNRVGDNGKRAIWELVVRAAPAGGEAEGGAKAEKKDETKEQTAATAAP